MLRKAALPVGLVLLVSSIAFGFYWTATHKPDCPGHWHATYQVFDEGEQLSFQHSRFDMRSMSMRTHIHQPKDYLMHLEAGCADVSEFFDDMGMDLKRSSFELDKELHDGKTLANEGNLTLRFFVASSNGTWQERPDLPSYQPRDGDRFLITYGNYTPEEIARQQAAVPQPTAS
ncbi:MAG: hypothetical protein ACYC2H_00610 [Thermoplasmatota archaeon]